MKKNSVKETDVQDKALNVFGSDRYEAFLRLYSVNQKRIFVYILSLVPSFQDAEDLLQQTMMEMWKLFDRFEPGTNFVAWGTAIARFQVMKFRNRQQKEKGVLFLNDEAFQIIQQESNRIQEESNDRLAALGGCVGKLKDGDKYILSLRYEEGLTYHQIAKKLGRSIALIYKKMAAIHTSLLYCIHQTLSLWDTQ
jgi:RNA polymerase sigma-70 factor (ECF subfamily)